MNPTRIHRRLVLRAALAAPVILGGTARAAGTIQMISHRYPALEHYAENMRGAIPGVTVNTQLMPIDKAMELATIALSSKSDTPDIVYASDTTFQTFVKNGWFRPLDDLWAKYKDEFKLDDFPDVGAGAVPASTAHLYVMPHTLNTMMFFYRKDLLDQAGKTPPTTIAGVSRPGEVVQLADARRHDQLPEAGRCRDERGALVPERSGRRLVRRGLASDVQHARKASPRSR